MKKQYEEPEIIVEKYEEGNLIFTSNRETPFVPNIKAHSTGGFMVED